MKTLGVRLASNPDNGIQPYYSHYIVELSAHEHDILLRSLEGENKVIREENLTRWRSGFRKEVKRMGLPSYHEAHLLRNVDEFDSFFRDRKSKTLMGFIQWAEAMLEGYAQRGKRGCHYFPGMCMGPKGYLLVIDALIRIRRPGQTRETWNPNETP